MRMLGGAAQTVAGAFVFIQVEVPVAAQVVGGIAMVNGVDDFAMGWRQLVSGREERGAIQTAATATVGLVTDNKAKAFGDGVSMGFGFVSPTGPMTGGPRVVPALAIELTEVIDSRVFQLKGRIHDINTIGISRPSNGT